MEIIWKDPNDLRPHPLSRELYGKPTENSEYGNLKILISNDGFDETKPLLITTDDRILCGCTRHAIAKSLKLDRVPCLLFRPKDPATAELEMERRIVTDNVSRNKPETVKAKEQRRLLQTEMELARRRMGGEKDGRPGKSTDAVGKIFDESGKQVQRRIKVLEAIEDAAAKGNHKRAQRLTELLDTRHMTKALDMLKPAKVREAERKAKVKVDVPPTFHEQMNRSYSANYEACAKATCKAEIELLQKNAERMLHDIEVTVERLRKQGVEFKLALLTVEMKNPARLLPAGDFRGQHGLDDVAPQVRLPLVQDKVSWTW
jgi:hypothetical protein